MTKLRGSKTSDLESYALYVILLNPAKGTDRGRRTLKTMCIEIFASMSSVLVIDCLPQWPQHLTSNKCPAKANGAARLLCSLMFNTHSVGGSIGMLRKGDPGIQAASCFTERFRDEEVGVA